MPAASAHAAWLKGLVTSANEGGWHKECHVLCGLLSSSTLRSKGGKDSSTGRGRVMRKLCEQEDQGRGRSRRCTSKGKSKGKRDNRWRIVGDDILIYRNIDICI